MQRSGRGPLWAGLLAIILHGGAASLLAEDAAPWDDHPFDAAPKAVVEAAAKIEQPKDADIEILLLDTTMRFDAEGRVERSTRRVFRVLTRQGVDEWATIEASWAPWHEERPTIRARVISPSGAVHTLDPASVGEVPDDQDSTVLSDRRKLRAPLPAIEVGAIAEWEFTVRESQPRFDRGDVYSTLLGQFLPMRRIRLTVDAPADFTLKHLVRGVELKPTRTEADGRVKLVFDYKPDGALHWPASYMPQEVPRWPTVLISTAKSWGNVAAGYSQIVEKQVDLDAVRPMVRSEIGKEKDRRAKIARLLAVVRRLVRYTGVAFGDAAIVPRKPDETLARRYGDCKDQALLLVCMLRAADIPAQVALLQTSDWRLPQPQMPGLGTFNHAIVYVPGDRPLWIDPTAEYVPCDHAPLFEQGQLALVADPATTELSRIPVGRYQENSYTNRFEFDFGRSYDAVVRELLTASGSCAWDVRSAYGELTKDQRRKNWDDYVKSTYAQGEVKKLDVGSMSQLDRPFTVEAVIEGGTVPQLLIGNRKRVVLLRPYELFDRVPYLLKHTASDEEEEDEGGDAGRRKQPLVLTEPHVATIEYRVVPPPGFVVEKLPSDSTDRFGPATLSRHFELADDGTVEGVFRFDTGPGRFTPDEVESLRKGIAALGKDGDLNQWQVELPLVHTAAEHLAAGRIKEAIAAHRVTLKRLPDCAVERMCYAQSLLAAGLGEAARQEARRAVELEPKSAKLQADLARVLVCDLVGRRFGRGMDWEAAAAAYRKALELYPDDVVARLDYAILLEHSPLGRRYAPDHLEESAKQYRLALEAGLQSPQQWYFNLSAVLVCSGHFDEVVKLPVDAESSDAFKALYLAAVAAHEGPEEAVRRSASLTGSPKQRKTVLQQAVVELDQSRQYPVAVALAETALAQAQIETFTSGLDHERRMRRWEPQDPPDADPQRLVRHVMAHLLAGCDLADVLPWFVEGTSEEDLEETYVLMLNRGNCDAGDEHQAVMPWRKADNVTVVEFEVNGDKRTGYHLRTASLEGLSRNDFYVIPTQKGLRMVAPGQGSSHFGNLAMALLDQGKSEQAKKLLEWAYEKQREAVGWFNPLSGTPFARIWWLAPPKSDEDLKEAAALLACGGPRAEKAIALLAKVRATPDLDTTKALQIDRALVSACLHHKQWTAALEAIDRLGKSYTKDFRVPRIETLAGLGRTDEALSLIRERLAEDRLDLLERGRLAVYAARCGDFELAQKTNLGLVPRANVKFDIYNEMAWNSIFLNCADEKAVGYGRKARDLTGGVAAGYLHTLAAVCAEVGNGQEAIDSLRRAIDQNHGVFRTYDWFVLGRLAEQYELRDVAADCYGKVTDDEPNHANSTYCLAQRRLKALGAKP